MLTLKPPAPTMQPFPWQQGLACREFRAMGFELELIELVRRREVAVSMGETVDLIDDQINEVSMDLAAEASVALRSPFQAPATMGEDKAVIEMPT